MFVGASMGSVVDGVGGTGDSSASGNYLDAVRAMEDEEKGEPARRKVRNFFLSS